MFFRESTRREAERLGILGWVKNEPDGTVSAHLEGDVSAVEQMIQWCSLGPQLARVKEVEQRVTTAEQLLDFRVVRA